MKYSFISFTALFVRKENILIEPKTEILKITHNIPEV